MQVVIILILGICFGSFINAYVWRVHKQTKSKAKKYSLVKGRSMCPNCGHELKTKDLIPVVSWLTLKGKCRYCHKAISAQYPLVEAITTVLFLLSYIYWPFAFNSQGIVYFVIWLILLVNLIALAVYDIKWMTLPNRIIYPMFVLVIIQIALTMIFYSGDVRYLLNSFIGFIIGGGIFYLLFQVSKGKWIGGGDVKLGALLGLYLGSGANAILLIFFASVIGSVYSLTLMSLGKIKRNALIPYGPFLIVAAIILRLFGASIISWFNSRGLNL